MRRERCRDTALRHMSLCGHLQNSTVLAAVSVSQIDKEGANAERVMQELSAHGVMPEDWGGDTPMVPVSTALHGIALYGIALYCIVLYCIVLYCMELHRIVLYSVVLFLRREA